MSSPVEWNAPSVRLGGSGGACGDSRLLAHLTSPPPQGRRSADSFAGRRRFVRFLDALQLELAVCFTTEEWERGFGLEELVELVAEKRSKPEQVARLAEKRLREARASRTAEPIKIAVFVGLVLGIPALFADGIVVRGALIAMWVAAVAAVAWLGVSEERRAQALVERTASRVD